MVDGDGGDGGDGKGVAPAEPPRRGTERSLACSRRQRAPFPRTCRIRPSRTSSGGARELAEARATKRRIEMELARAEDKMRELAVRVERGEMGGRARRGRRGRGGAGEEEGEDKAGREGDARRRASRRGAGRPASPGGYEGEGETNSRTRKYEG